MINKAYAPLRELYLFREYQTRDEYEKVTGKPCPPYNPDLPAKHWEDPEPKAMGRFVLYTNILATSDDNEVLVGPDGNPFFEPLSLPIAQAKTVNIPIKESANEPGVKFTIQPPCRNLEGDEQLIFQPGVPFRVVVVHRPSLLAVDTPVQWTTGDRELLRRIAAKLGV